MSAKKIEAVDLVDDIDDDDDDDFDINAEFATGSIKDKSSVTDSSVINDNQSSVLVNSDDVDTTKSDTPNTSANTDLASKQQQQLQQLQKETASSQDDDPIVNTSFDISDTEPDRQPDPSDSSKKIQDQNSNTSLDSSRVNTSPPPPPPSSTTTTTTTTSSNTNKRPTASSPLKLPRAGPYLYPTYTPITTPLPTDDLAAEFKIINQQPTPSEIHYGEMTFTEWAQAGDKLITQASEIIRRTIEIRKRKAEALAAVEGMIDDHVAMLNTRHAEIISEKGKLRDRAAHMVRGRTE